MSGAWPGSETGSWPGWARLGDRAAGPARPRPTVPAQRLQEPCHLDGQAARAEHLAPAEPHRPRPRRGGLEIACEVVPAVLVGLVADPTVELDDQQAPEVGGVATGRAPA